MHKDDINQKVHDNKERQKKKSGAPQENRNVDPVKDAGRFHEAGKGDKIRDMQGWYSDEVSDTLEKIFGKKKWKKKLEKNKDSHEEKN